MTQIELNAEQRESIMKAIKDVHILAEKYGVDKLNMNLVINSLRKDLTIQAQNFLMCIGLATFEEGWLNFKSEDTVETEKKLQ